MCTRQSSTQQQPRHHASYLRSYFFVPVALFLATWSAIPLQVVSLFFPSQLATNHVSLDRHTSSGASFSYLCRGIEVAQQRELFFSPGHVLEGWVPEQYVYSAGVQDASTYLRAEVVDYEDDGEVSDEDTEEEQAAGSPWGLDAGARLQVISISC